MSMKYLTYCLSLIVLVVVEQHSVIAWEVGVDKATSWINLAMEFANDAEDPSTISNVYANRAIIYAKHSEFDKAISDTRKSGIPSVVATALTRQGNAKAALRVVASLPRGKSREQAKAAIVYSLGQIHDFDLAKIIVGEIEDYQIREDAKLLLAIAQARAGQYDAAISSIKKSLELDKNPSNAEKQSMRKCALLIEQYRAQGVSEPPLKPYRQVTDRFRELSSRFDLNHRNMQDSEQMADALATSVDKSQAWLEIAWARLGRNELKACQNAREEATGYATAITHPGKAAIAYLRLADLALELDEAESAIALAENAISKVDKNWLARKLSQPDGPGIFGIFMRSGKGEIAMEAVSKISGPTASHLWLAIGAFSWSEGNQDYITDLLNSGIPSGAKGSICLGVAMAIQGKSQQ